MSENAKGRDREPKCMSLSLAIKGGDAAKEATYLREDMFIMFSMAEKKNLPLVMPVFVQNEDVGEHLPECPIVLLPAVEESGAH